MSDRSGRSLVWVAAAVLLVAVGWMAFRSGFGEVPTQTEPTGSPVASATTPRNATISPSPVSPEANPAGFAPGIRPDANANAASVAEAARSGRNPERMSLLIAPKPFDPAVFSANPQQYLDVIEPGRVFQSAQPGVGVPVLEIKGVGSRQIPVGGSCELTVSTAPQAPVTFTTMDLGTFSNGLTTITVRADATGEARATYAASGGVIAEVKILVGSPLASGQVKFHVVVVEPPVAANR